MGFRFRKYSKILPGVKLNFSKSGVSTSLGKKGSMVNFSRKGTRGTIGIPGTGLSYSTKTGKGTIWPLIIAAAAYFFLTYIYPEIK